MTRPKEPAQPADVPADIIEALAAIGNDFCPATKMKGYERALSRGMAMGLCLYAAAVGWKRTPNGDQALAARRMGAA